MDSDELKITEMGSVTIISGTPAQFLADSERKLAEAPDDDLLKCDLAVSLFGAGRYTEAARLASTVAQVGTGYESASKDDAYRELIGANVRARDLLWKRVEAYAGPEGARMMVEQWDKVAEGLEEERAKLSHAGDV